MADNYLMLNGKRFDLTDEQMEKLVINLKQTDLFNFKKEDVYYCITDTGEIDQWIWYDKPLDFEVDSVANACKDKKLMEQRVMHETLDRLLWRFSCENGELENPWDGNAWHYYIYVNKKEQRFTIRCNKDFKVNTQHFPTRDLAEKAIDEIIVPFCTTHPDFVW